MKKCKSKITDVWESAFITMSKSIFFFFQSRSSIGPETICPSRRTACVHLLKRRKRGGWLLGLRESQTPMRTDTVSVISKWGGAVRNKTSSSVQSTLLI